jgi:hypothetical protein
VTEGSQHAKQAGSYAAVEIRKNVFRNVVRYFTTAATYTDLSVEYKISVPWCITADENIVNLILRNK